MQQRAGRKKYIKQAKKKGEKSWAEKKERVEWWVLVADTGRGAKGARRVTHGEPKERSLLGES